MTRDEARWEIELTMRGLIIQAGELKAALSHLIGTKYQDSLWEDIEDNKRLQKELETIEKTARYGDIFPAGIVEEGLRRIKSQFNGLLAQ